MCTLWEGVSWKSVEHDQNQILSMLHLHVACPPPSYNQTSQDPSGYTDKPISALAADKEQESACDLSVRVNLDFGLLHCLPVPGKLGTRQYFVPQNVHCKLSLMNQTKCISCVPSDILAAATRLTRPDEAGKHGDQSDQFAVHMAATPTQKTKEPRQSFADRHLHRWQGHKLVT